MMQLQDILYGVALKQVVGLTQRDIASITLDSRTVSENTLFFAVPGTAVDGHQFIDSAIEKGATAILCSHLPENQSEAVTYLQVDDVRKAMAICAANFYDHPSKKLKLIGVTGTNGKTTIVTLGHQLFTGLGVMAGLLSTIENKIGNNVFASKLTTPDSITVNKMLAQMVDEGCEACFMEVSSHAVVQHRVTGLHFAMGVFTNISRDHLDYHKTFKEYIAAKQEFFNQLPKTAFAIYNADDKNGEIMVQNTKANKVSYGLRNLAMHKVKILEDSMNGLLLNIDGFDVYTQLSGDFNALNLTAIYTVATILGEDPIKVLEVLSSLNGASGRFEKVISPNKVIAIVDYAHTPDALKKVLQTINKTRTGNEELITVVGCGGNRDKGKRPEMAKIAAQLSTQVILTSDNPRNESPLEIIEDMSKGVPISSKANVRSISDRREAILTAVAMAKPSDIILVAGKGHETYQEIKGERFPFDDREELRKAFSSHEKNKEC